MSYNIHSLSFVEISTLAFRTTSDFLDFKNKGGLTKPDYATNLIVRLSNSCVERIRVQSGNILKERHIFTKITTQVLSVIHSRHPKMLSELDSHADPQFPSHKVAMIKKIIHCFLSVKLSHLCKEYNQNALDKKIRRNMTKTILFQGQ